MAPPTFMHKGLNLAAGLTVVVFAVIGSAFLRGGQAAVGVGLILLGTVLAACLAFLATHSRHFDPEGGAASPRGTQLETIRKILIALSVTPLVAGAMYVTIAFDLDEPESAVAFVAACGWLALFARWCRFGFRKMNVLADAAWAAGTVGFYASLWTGSQQTGWLFPASKGLVVLAMGGIIAGAAFTAELQSRLTPGRMVVFAAGVVGLFVFSVLGYAPPGLIGSLIQRACLLAMVVFVTLYFSALMFPTFGGESRSSRRAKVG